MNRILNYKRHVFQTATFSNYEDENSVESAKQVSHQAEADVMNVAAKQRPLWLEDFPACIDKIVVFFKCSPAKNK